MFYNWAARSGGCNAQFAPNQSSNWGAFMATGKHATHRVDSQDMAECRVCGETKPHSDYYARQLRICGTVGECKECTKDRVRRRARLSDKVRQYERDRAKRPDRMQRNREVSDAWNAKNPLAYKAHYTVTNAVRDGRLNREPCLFCGAEKVHAHHKDYTQPLSVIWLCPKCHHRLHKYFPETEASGKGNG